MHAPATGLIAASACPWCETMAYVLRLAHAAGRKKHETERQHKSGALNLNSSPSPESCA